MLWMGFLYRLFFWSRFLFVGLNWAWIVLGWAGFGLGFGLGKVWVLVWVLVWVRSV